MPLLIAGLVLFLGVHFVPVVPPLRGAWASALGDRRYRGLFSLVAIAGLLMVIAGYVVSGPGPRVFAPSVGAIHAAPFVVTIAFILLAASHMRGRIRKTLRHPMVIGVVLWSAVHLLANGDLRGTILFGSFLAWSLLDLASSLARGGAPAYEPIARHDVMAVVGGIVVALVVMLLHRVLFGVAPVSFSL
jgi:uncharacterized membrane protein